MKRKNKVFIYLIITTLFSITLLTILHENSHKIIYEESGCTNVTINYGLHSTTSAYCNLSKEMDTALFQAQANVESHYDFLALPIIILMFILVLIK